MSEKIFVPNKKGHRNGVVTLTVITILTPNGYSKKNYIISYIFKRIYDFCL